jgi:hypothetical protein
LPLSNLRLLTAPLLTAILAVGLLGCGSQSKTSASAVPEVRSMRFAGVDLEYALERIAAEAGIPLALDEIFPRDRSPDLGLYRVDVDLKAGPVDQVLQQLKQSAGGFDFELLDGIIYVRSQLLVTAKTPLDLPLLPATQFKGTLDELVTLVLKKVPYSFMTYQSMVGGPETPVVELDIADKTSVRDVFLAYARAAKLGWRIRRAGQVVEDAKVGTAIVGTSIEARRPRTSTSQRPDVFNRMSTVGAVAEASKRLATPMVVLDRSVVLNTRGNMDFSSQKDPEFPLKETLDDLAASGWGPTVWYFKWKMLDGVPLLESDRYLYTIQGRELFHEELLSGEFEGTLGDLARWINTHRKNRSDAVLMGGEIVEGQPRAKLTIAPGTTVQQALVAFAKATGVSEYAVVLDMTSPISGKQVDHPHAWHGAYLQDLADWKQTWDGSYGSSGPR